MNREIEPLTLEPPTGKLLRRSQPFRQGQSHGNMPRRGDVRFARAFRNLLCSAREGKTAVGMQKMGLFVGISPTRKVSTSPTFCLSFQRVS
jgi:hypothetical protein